MCLFSPTLEVGEGERDNKKIQEKHYGELLMRRYTAFSSFKNRIFMKHVGWQVKRRMVWSNIPIEINEQSILCVELSRIE
jgi:hypothetical protein